MCIYRNGSPASSGVALDEVLSDDDMSGRDGGKAAVGSKLTSEAKSVLPLSSSQFFLSLPVCSSSLFQSVLPLSSCPFFLPFFLSLPVSSSSLFYCIHCYMYILAVVQSLILPHSVCKPFVSVHDLAFEIRAVKFFT